MAVQSIGTQYNSLKILNSHANLDYWYGPYYSIDEAKRIPPSIRAKGLTVGIIENGEVVEYQWKRGTGDNDLEVKAAKALGIEIVSVTTIPNTDNNTITFKVTASGNGFGIQTSIYLGSIKLASGPTILNTAQEFIVLAPENPGNYIYNVLVIDTILNNGDLKSVNVTWKEIDLRVSSSSSINNFKVKSLENLSAASFLFLVYKVDSVTIEHINVLYGNNSMPLALTYDNIYRVNINDLLPNLNQGDLIQIEITGTGLTETFVKDIVQLTAPGIFPNILGTIPSKVFNDKTFLAKLYFEAEKESRYLVIIKDGQEEVYNSLLLSYLTNNISLKLKDINLNDLNRTSIHVLDVYIEDSSTKKWTFSPLTVEYFNNTELLDVIPGTTGFRNNLDFSEIGAQQIGAASYILDLNCFIPSSDSNEVLFSFLDITINKDFISFGGRIKYPTPLLLNISLGFMRHVITGGYTYDALFINGVLCYKMPSTTENTIVLTKDIRVIDKVSNIENGIRFYYDATTSISLEDFVLETNYKARNLHAEVENLPKLILHTLQNVEIQSNKYKIGQFGNLIENGELVKKYVEIGNDNSGMIQDFINAYGKSGIILPSDLDAISKLAKEVKKDCSKIPDKYTTLIKLTVGSKKLLQKYVAVPCLWEYLENGNVKNSGYLLAFTLGTSTLEYLIPNFTFKFYTSSNFDTTVKPALIPKINRSLDNLLSYSTLIDENTQYYLEKELVAKVDYMESSHLNNTPTAMFYNAIVSLNNGYAVDDNPNNNILRNPVPNKLNAIEGMPVVIVIDGVNYGSFMLNLGKTASSIGFEVQEGQGISLEGTSNHEVTGKSSRFEFGSKQLDLSAKAYLESINNVDEISEINEDFAEFLRDGLEYRYSGADVDDIGDNLAEYKRIVKMWKWVYDHETYTKEQFEEMFNFEAAALYYIQMMIFGLTDNLGKNCMFDQFEEDGLWYVRPYDMDSQAGLDNNGKDDYSPVIEISLDFVLDEETRNITTVPYLDGESDRFPYSSKTSNLWKRFYNCLRSDIEAFYKKLRNISDLENHAGYSAEGIINLCKKEVIDKLGIHLYNIDFKNKYLMNSNPAVQQFAYGNRWVRFKDWIEKRFDFCDTYFKYNVYNADLRASTKQYNIVYSLPQYTLNSYNDALGGTNITTHWGTLCTLDISTSVTKLLLYFSPKYILNDDNFFLSGLSSITPRVKLNTLTNYSGNWHTLSNVIDLSDNTYMLKMIINDINSSQSAIIPKCVVELTLSGSQIPYIDLYELLTILNLTNCIGTVELNDCRKLETLRISLCKNLTLKLTKCGSENKKINVIIENSTFEEIVLNESYIRYLGLNGLTLKLSFVGATSYISTLDLEGSNMLDKTLDITLAEINNLILNNISETKVIIQNNNKKSFNYLGLKYANITLWGNTEGTFDGGVFNNINSIKMIDDITSNVRELLKNDNYSNTNAVGFRLFTCSKIIKIKDLRLTGAPARLFEKCTSLQHFIGNNEIRAAGDHMFDGCYNLQDLPNTIEISDTSGVAMFRSCQKLSYSEIETKVLEANQSGGACKLTNYNLFLANKTYNGNTTINLSLYANATTMIETFSSFGFGSSADYPQDNRNAGNPVTITIEGTLPANVTSVAKIFGSSTAHIYNIVNPAGLFANCQYLTDLSYSFYNLLNTLGNPFVAPQLPNNDGLILIGTFLNCKLLDPHNLKNNNNKLSLPSKTQNCDAMFYSATFSGEEKTDVHNAFEGCLNLVSATNCFRNVGNFKCDGQLILNINNNNSINIAGIFAKNTTTKIPYGFTTTKWYSNPEASNYSLGWQTITSDNRNGPYSGTEITFDSDNVSITIQNNEENVSDYKLNVLEGAIIDNEENSITITLTINAKYCNNICKNLRAYENTQIHPCTLQINELSRIERANYAFSAINVTETNKKIDIKGPSFNAYRIGLPNSLIEATYMFASSKIELLPTGFLNCSTLNDIRGMFLNCSLLLDHIPQAFYGDAVSYFLPISVKNINYLFDGCPNLYGGIPETFIEYYNNDNEERVTNDITTLIRVFSGTGILHRELTYTNEDYALDISVMFPNVTNVTGLFYWNGTSSSSRIGNILTINANCFSKCTICDHLFNSSYINLPTGCNFSNANSLRFAFATGHNRVRYITALIGGISNKADITGLFSSDYKKDLNSEIQSNIELLRSSLILEGRTLYTGLFYGYNNDTSLNEYKWISPETGYSITYAMHA